LKGRSEQARKAGLLRANFTAWQFFDRAAPAAQRQWQWRMRKRKPARALP